jgi:hypothetical protein
MFALRGYRAGGAAIALSLGLALVGVVRAQEAPAVAGGLVSGEVDRCTDTGETPASGVHVGIDGGSLRLAATDSSGQFTMLVPVGTYTVIATADDGSTANRPYVPVDNGVQIDIGILDLGAGPGGCGTEALAPPPSQPAAPAQQVATATPSPEPTAPPPTATAVPPPTPTPEATPEPDATDTGG